MTTTNNSGLHSRGGGANDHQPMGRSHSSATSLAAEISPGTAWFANNFGQEDGKFVDGLTLFRLKLRVLIGN